jgi:Flp pilus assembly pilin Flp
VNMRGLRLKLTNGQTMTEYALILAVVASVAFMTYEVIGQDVTKLRNMPNPATKSAASNGIIPSSTSLTPLSRRILEVLGRNGPLDGKTLARDLGEPLGALELELRRLEVGHLVERMPNGNFMLAT